MVRLACIPREFLGTFEKFQEMFKEVVGSLKGSEVLSVYKWWISSLTSNI